MQAETVIIDELNYILDEEAKTASVTWTLDHLSGNIVIPDNVSYSGVTYSVTSIGDHAFDYFYRFFVNIPEGEEEIWFEDFRMAGTGITGIVIPESVTSIGRSAFASCSDLTSINIPESITSVGECAFGGCYSLREFSGNSSFISSDRRCLIIDGTPVAFAQSGLSSYNIPNDVTKIGRNAFNDCRGLTGIIIPDGVTSIEEQAFKDCTNLTSITIPSSVTSIGNSAFSDCTSLTGITVPEGVTVIEDGTFNNCNRLTDIVLPESVTTIGWAFIACRNLTSINIPKGVRQINTQAFDSCWRLQDVFCYAKAVPNGVNKITADCSPIFKATLHVPASAIDKYKTTYPWNQFGKIIPMTRKGLHPVSQVRTLL